MRRVIPFEICFILFFACYSLLFTQDISSQSCPQFERVIVQTDGAQLFCQVLGKSDPIVVLHGGPGLSQEYLLPYMAKLGETNRVIFYDQRACGQSTGEIAEDLITLEKFLEDIEAIRMTFGYHTITVLGHSWGGFLAMQYAIKYPQSVKRLILVNSVPASSEEFAECEKEWAVRMASYQGEIKNIQASQAYSEGDPESTQKYLKRMFCLYFYDPKNRDRINWKMAPNAFLDGMKVHALLRNELGSYTLHEALRKLRVPTLIIHGENDPLFASFARTIHESIAGSSFVLLPCCGHFSYLEAPELFFQSLSTFLKNTN